MITLGMDIGSRTVKAVALDALGGEILASAVADITTDVAADARAMLERVSASAGAAPDVVLATGYGRASAEFADHRATEITCHALGVAVLHPEVRTVIDIGGQDSKALRIAPGGRVLDFAMNDRCAAGTGRFLEVAAGILGTDAAGLAELAERGGECPEMSSMCVVFVESEILGMLSRGVGREHLALGLHRALARRVAGLLQRCGLEPPVAFTGGVALNRAMVRAIGAELRLRLVVPSEPQLTGALGAALLAAKREGLEPAPLRTAFPPPERHVRAETGGATRQAAEDEGKGAPAPPCGAGAVLSRPAGFAPPPPPLRRFERMIADCSDYLKIEKERGGRKVVAIFCEYTPRELILAAGAAPVCMCGGSHRTALIAEGNLPANLCPLIKSSYGYVLDGSSPFFELADLVVAETTCDGKKKMYELLAERKPVHVLELTQKPDVEEAYRHWKSEVLSLALRLEELTGRRITRARLLEAVRLMNEERRLRAEIASLVDYGLSGREVLLAKSSVSCRPEDLEAYRELIRLCKARGPVTDGRPRILMTGVPMPDGAEKVLDIVEQCGGLVVAQENCTGLKPLLEPVAEEGDLFEAVARKYFHLPCSCMTPNAGRFELVAELAERFRPHGVIDLVWQACHTYNVEAERMKRFVTEELGLPYLKIETDYSPSDIENIRLRVEAFLALAAPR